MHRLEINNFNASESVSTASVRNLYKSREITSRRCIYRFFHWFPSLVFVTILYRPAGTGEKGRAMSETDRTQRYSASFSSCRHDFKHSLECEKLRLTDGLEGNMQAYLGYSGYLCVFLRRCCFFVPGGSVAKLRRIVGSGCCEGILGWFLIVAVLVSSVRSRWETEG